jgi:hypothetical protein
VQRQHRSDLWLQRSVGLRHGLLARLQHDDRLLQPMHGRGDVGHLRGRPVRSDSKQLQSRGGLPDDVCWSRPDLRRRRRDGCLRLPSRNCGPDMPERRQMRQRREQLRPDRGVSRHVRRASNLWRRRPGQRVRLHAEDDGRGVRGQELRWRVGRLRRQLCLRELHAAGDVWRRLAPGRQRVRVHAANRGRGLRYAHLRDRAQRMWGQCQLWPDGGKLSGWNGLLERHVLDELRAARRVPRWQELRDDGQRVRNGDVDVRRDGRKLPRWSNLRRRESRLAQRVRLHGESDGNGVRGQELRPRVRWLRGHDQLRVLYAASNVRRRDAERRERVRLHAGVDGDGLHGEELRPGLQRLWRKLHVRIVLAARDLWGRGAEHGERVWLHAAECPAGVSSGTKLQHGAERLWRHCRLRIMHSASNVRRQRDPRSVRMHPELPGAPGSRCLL